MDWLRQVPIGQYVAGSASWLRHMDSRLKLGWVLMFLMTPILAGAFWRIFLAFGLLTITFASCLPVRIWWRPLLLALILAMALGLLGLFLPMGEPPGVMAFRSPQELPGANLISDSWESVRIAPLQLGPFSLGPLVIGKGSVELALNTSTLIFTVVHSVNLMLLTTPPEDLVWAICWFISPLALIGVPIERLSFQLLLALRFLPLVQEELQNLLRALSSRAVNIRELGFKGSFALILSVAERLLANILLRADQGADALMARGVLLRPAYQLRTKPLPNRASRWLNLVSGILLVLVFSLRGKYGDL